MNNKQIAGILHHLGDLLEISGENSFRVGAYRRAARALENSRHSAEKMEGRLTEISGIGAGMAQLIEEILHTGTAQLLEEKKAALPPGLIDLLQLPGVGPKTIFTLYQQLNITQIDQLQQAAENQEIRPLKGFGPKKEEKILAAITSYQNRPKRVLWPEALLLAETLLGQIRSLPQVEKAELAGSLRRKKESIKDIDLVVATQEPEELADQIAALPETVEMVQQGNTKIHFLAHIDRITLPVDIRLVSSNQFPHVWHHLTGSQEHNVRIRQRAKELGYKVNEYGIEDSQTGEMITLEDESSLFARLQLPFIAPELREDRGEFEASDEGKLPNLLAQEMYRGDLHTHSLYSDGAHSILEMAQAAQKRGYQYLAVTDHSQSLKVASGLTIAELQEQWEEIDRLNQGLSDLVILKGTEVDILADGSLDYPDDILAEMDIVIASVHTSFRQDQKRMTSRVIKAMENPYVHIIGHPTGRLLLGREPYEIDMDQIFQTAKDTGTILELNANPHRLDLHDLHLKKAKEEYQLKFSINTDAHSKEALDLIRFGIGTARRGWLEACDVLNMQPWGEGKKWLKRV